MGAFEGRVNSLQREFAVRLAAAGECDQGCSSQCTDLVLAHLGQGKLAAD